MLQALRRFAPLCAAAPLVLQQSGLQWSHPRPLFCVGDELALADSLAPKKRRLEGKQSLFCATVGFCFGNQFLKCFRIQNEVF